MLIPPELWDYANKPAHFVTYFGDIYYGYLTELHGYNDGFFIVQMDKAKRLREELEPHERTPEEYRKLGREIKDPKVIKAIYEDKIGTDIHHEGLSYNGEQEFKRMFVFGAAASAFCTFGEQKSKYRDCELCSPTGLEVFAEKYEAIIDSYPGAKLSIPNFAARGYDTEQCLEEEWEVYKNTYSPEIAARHLNIQYYLQDLLGKVTTETVTKFYRQNLYSLLLSKLQIHLAKTPKERVTVVTFNYDTILESFASQIFHKNFDTLEDYVDYHNRQLVLIKPHGSINWGWPINPSTTSGVTNISTALYQQQIEPWQLYYQLIGDINDVIAPNTWGYEYGNHQDQLGRFTINKNLIQVIPTNKKQHYFPALMIPYRDKDEFVMPYKHSELLEDSFDKIEELYLIGWKGNEALFNRKLSKARNLKKIYIVNPKASEVKAYLSKYLDLDSIDMIEVDSFEEFVLTRIDDVLRWT